MAGVGGDRAVAIYIMTHDYALDMPPEGYKLIIAGAQPKGAKLTYPDPITGTTEAVPCDSLPNGALQVTLSVTDYPRILTIAEP